MSEIRIEETTTQALSPAVKLGCGNFWEETYQENGAEKTGNTAGLWVIRADTRSTDHVRVHAGQKLTVPGHKITVLAVTPGVGMAHGEVRIEVQPA